jgi:hypothetical protein
MQQALPQIDSGRQPWKSGHAAGDGEHGEGAGRRPLWQVLEQSSRQALQVKVPGKR